MREHATSRAALMLRSLHLDISCRLSDELEALGRIERADFRFDLAIEVANLVLERLGAPVSAPADPRFDKTRRAMAKVAPKPLRGEKAGRTKAERRQAQGGHTQLPEEA